MNVNRNFVQENGLSNSIKDVYFPFQRSFIDLLGKSVYSEKIPETRLCRTLNFLFMLNAWSEVF